MARIGIFFGTSSGATSEVAERIQAELGGEEHARVHDIAGCGPEDLARYPILLLGTSTLGCGELQDDWERFRRDLEQMDLSGKQVALFGLGDQADFCRSFVDGIGILHRIVVNGGAEVVGYWDAVDQFEFGRSAAVVDGRFVGLVIDEENEPERTAARVQTWTRQLVDELESAVSRARR